MIMDFSIWCQAYSESPVKNSAAIENILACTYAHAFSENPGIVCSILPIPGVPGVNFGQLVSIP